MLVLISLPRFYISILDLKDKRVKSNLNYIDTCYCMGYTRYCSNDVTHFMCSDPSEIEMKSLWERFPLGDKSQL